MTTTRFPPAPTMSLRSGERAPRDVHHRSLAQAAVEGLVSTVTSDGATLGLTTRGEDDERDRAEGRDFPDGQDHLRRSVPALGGGQLEGVRPRLLEGSRGLAGAQRRPAQ